MDRPNADDDEDREREQLKAKKRLRMDDDESPASRRAEIDCITIDSSTTDDSNSNGRGQQQQQKRTRGAGGLEAEPICLLDSSSGPSTPVAAVRSHEIVLPESPGDQGELESDNEEEEVRSPSFSGRLQLVRESSESMTLPDMDLGLSSSSRSMTRKSPGCVVETITLSSTDADTSPEDSNLPSASVLYTATTFDAHFARTGELRKHAEAAKRSRLAKMPVVRDRNNNEMLEFDDAADKSSLDNPPAAITPQDASASLRYLITQQTVTSFSNENSFNPFAGHDLSASGGGGPLSRSTSLLGQSNKLVSRSASKVSLDDARSDLSLVDSKRARTSMASTSSSRERASRLRDRDKSSGRFKRLSLAADADIKLAQFRPIVKLTRIEDDVYEFYQTSWQREKEHKKLIGDVFSESSEAEPSPAKTLPKTPPSIVLDRNLTEKKVSAEKKKAAVSKPRPIEPPDLFDENTNFFNDDHHQQPVASPVSGAKKRKLKLISSDSQSSSSQLEKTTTEVVRSAPSSASKTPAGAQAPKRPLSEETSQAPKRIKLCEAKAPKTPETKTLPAKIAPKPPSSTAPAAQPPKTTPSKLPAVSGVNRTSTPAQRPLAKQAVENFKIPKIARSTAPEPTPKPTAPTPTTAKQLTSTAKTSAAPAPSPGDEKKKLKVKKTTNDSSLPSNKSSDEKSTASKVVSETTCTVVTRSMATAEPMPAPTLDLFRQQYLSQPTTISQHHERRSLFNKSINCAHPFFNFGYLIMEYLNQVTLVSSLDFDFLITTCPQDQNDELNVRSLTRDQQIELCRLMSRNAGRLNYYRFLGFGADFRHSKTFWPNNKQLVQQYHNLVDHFKKVELILSNLSSMTLAEAYALYCAYQTKLSTPYRQITVFHNPQFACKAISSRFGKFDIKVEIQNDGCIIADRAASMEDLVIFALHRKNEYSLDLTIRSSLVQSFAARSPKDDGEVEGEDEESNCLTYDAKIRRAQELINDKHTFDNLYVNSVYRKNSTIKFPPYREVAARCLSTANYIEQCKNGQIKPPKVAATSEASRFATYKAITNENRGDMQQANKFRILTNTETQRIMNELEAQQAFKKLNIFKLFKNRA